MADPLHEAMFDAHQRERARQRGPYPLPDGPRHNHHLPWFVVPEYTPPAQGDAADVCTVVNRRGEFVASFEDIEDARLCVARVNGGKA